MFSSEGENWRLAWDPQKEKYSCLISVNYWSIELEKKEFYSLYKVLNNLYDVLTKTSDKLMNEEMINLELEKSPWYIELEGIKNEWSLRIIFESTEQTRSFEMYWPIPIAEALFFEIRKMWESMQ